MKALVIGSGLIGITTAYFLRRRGHEVTVIDRQAGPGRETSFANGSLLTPSMAEPWNAPGSWRVLLKSIGRSDSPMQLRLGALPSLSSWGISFLRNSSPERFERNSLSNLRLGEYSLGVMRSLRQETGIDYGGYARGTLRIFRDPSSLELATVWANRKASAGLTFRSLSADEAAALEPGLKSVAGELAGALHYPGDETGDAHRFCVALAEISRQHGVEFRHGIDVSALEMKSGSLAGVVCGSETLTADRYVVAAGSYTTPLLRQIGIHVPVRPVKGYSITFDDDGTHPALTVPVVDDDLHAAVVPLQGALRVAGTAEFTGYDRTVRPERIRNLVRLVEKVLPQVRLDHTTAKPWCGLRPVCVDGVPVIGATSMPNVFVNTGHGHLGWTMAAGSGQLLAELISGERASIDAVPYRLERFA